MPFTRVGVNGIDLESKKVPGVDQKLGLTSISVLRAIMAAPTFGAGRNIPRESN